MTARLRLPRLGRRSGLIVAVVAVGVAYAALNGVAVLTGASRLFGAPGASVVYAVGDLGGLQTPAPALAQMLLRRQFDALLTLGDMAAPDGSPAAYRGAYHDLFGVFDARVRPAPGPTDHRSGSGYDAYFREHAPGYKNPSYYAFSVGGWRIFSLDSNAPATPDSPMYGWLRRGLSTTTEACVAAYWHDSGTGAAAAMSDKSPMRYVWDLLAANHADVVLTASARVYKRFDPQDGITAFLVGTGGVGQPPLASGQSSGASVPTSGALELALDPNAADFTFHTSDDRATDSGRIACHGRQPAPAGRPATPANLQAKPVPQGISLIWQPKTGGTASVGFVVLRGEEVLAFVTEPHYIDTTLAPGASVLYTVRAIDGAGATSQESNAAHSGGSHPGFTDYRWANNVNPASPTADKPQSKLWFNAGSWWGTLWATDPRNPNHAAYYIQRFDPSTQDWTNTDVQVDDRDRSHADVLWDPARAKLYVASTIDSGAIKLFRYSWNSGAYHPDDGFPVRLSETGSESVTIAKGADGTLWATITQPPDGGGVCVSREPCIVRVMHSLDTDWHWTAPTPLPTPEATADPDDISTVVSFGHQVGVAWSNQRVGGFFFAVHSDGAPDTTWDVESITVAPRGADDHMNVKADAQGRVYLITKTSLNDPANASPNDPLMVLWVREPDGQWRHSTVWTVKEDTTRPQVLVDPTGRRVYAIAAAPGNGGAIYAKAADIDSLVFTPGLGSVLMAVGTINNPTTTKQPVSLAAGILVLAGDSPSHTYWHALITPDSFIAP